MNKHRVVTRMAPSPTGEFHIGGMRTLLYNFAWARKNKGSFLLRIEDTDQTRLVEGSTERIYDVIKAYGLSWDEGPQVGGPHGPYIQSERLDIYKKYTQELVQNEKAYYCFCSAERLDQMREAQKSKGIAAPKYDRHCLSLSKAEIEKKLEANEPFVVRQKVPRDYQIKWIDGVLGEVSFNSNDIDDQILIKSDGFPTYHFAVVVDDHLMEVTHVMRGNEWLPSTPKHILLYEAFGWDIPKYLHLPNLKEIGSNKKLSKRHGPVSAQGFLDEGYLPEALLNYVMFLGWNPGGERELYSVDEFIETFDITRIHKTDLVAFDRKKLEWFNAQYIKQKSDTELAQLLSKFSPNSIELSVLSKIAPLVKDRMKKLSEFEEITRFFFAPQAIDRSLFSENHTSHLQVALKVLSELKSFTTTAMNEGLMAAVKEKEFHTGHFFMDLRLAIAGSKVTPPLNESMEIIGQDEVVSRLTKALQ